MSTESQPDDKTRKPHARKVPYKTAQRADDSPKKQTGRTDKRLDRTFTKAFFRDLRDGLPIKRAAERAMISNSTVFRWLQEARAADSEGKSGTLAQQFRDSMKKAQSDAVHRNLLIIKDAANKSWQAAAWWLERHSPNEWGRKDRPVTDDELAPAPPPEKLMTDEEKDAVLTAVLARRKVLRERKAARGGD